MVCKRVAAVAVMSKSIDLVYFEGRFPESARGVGGRGVKGTSV